LPAGKGPDFSSRQPRSPSGLYDPQAGRRLKTVELIVESIAWRPRPRARRSDDEIVAALRPLAQTQRLGSWAHLARSRWRSVFFLCTGKSSVALIK